MIKLRDSVMLSNIKIKNYKGKSIFALVSIVLGLTTIIAASMALYAVFNLVRESFKSDFAERHFVEVFVDPFCSNQSFWPVENPEEEIYEIDCETTFNYEEFKNHFNNFNFLNTFQSKTSSDEIFWIEGVDLPDKNSSQAIIKPVLASKNIELLYDHFYEGMTFEDKNDGKIPVLIPLSVVMKNYMESYEIEREELYLTKKEIIEKYKGRDITIKSAVIDSDTKEKAFNEYNSNIDFTQLSFNNIPNNFKVVGIINMDSGPDTEFVIPEWSLSKYPELGSMVNHSGNYYLELDSADAKKNLSIQFYDELNQGWQVSSETNPKNNYKFANLNVNPVYNSGAQIKDLISLFVWVIIGICGFYFVVIAFFMFFIISKMVSEGKKEVAVFRAYGAMRSDIKKIFFSYVLLLTNVAFIISVTLALIINTAISMIYGNDFFYGLFIFSGAKVIEKPDLIFVGINALVIFGILLFANLVAIIASAYPIWRASKIQPMIALRDE